MRPLKFLFAGWFSMVMGLAGLALAWQRAVPLMGEMAGAASVVIGLVAAAAFVALAAAMLLRAKHHPGAWAEDLKHPVRHAFVAAVPASAILLVTLAVALGARGPGIVALWMAAVGAQLWVTLRVLGRWWQPGGLPWPAATPVLVIPVVGNVLAPLAGVPLGQPELAAVAFGVGLLFWPVVLALLVVRLAQQGPWPDRLRPTAFILAAPPAVVGLDLLHFGAPATAGWACWGVAVFSLAWAARQLRQIADQPFGLSHWAMSFPLAATAALTCRLATPGGALAVLAPVLLALASLVVVALVLGTWRGLRDGSLLAPEPAAVITPVAVS